jgi:hypothetical protein
VFSHIITVSSQAAVETQLEALQKEQPNAKIVLVTVRDDVRVHTGSHSHIIAGDKLFNFDTLLHAHETEQIKLESSIEKSKEHLSKTLFSLEENGQTALGPALVVSLGLCSQKAGSKIVICTDGKANVGVGALDEVGNSEEKRNEAELFYDKVANFAKQSGTVISVLRYALELIILGTIVQSDVFVSMC